MKWFWATAIPLVVGSIFIPLVVGATLRWICRMALRYKRWAWVAIPLIVVGYGKCSTWIQCSCLSLFRLATLASKPLLHEDNSPNSSAKSAPLMLRGLGAV
jgi:hypothetical protein